MLLLLAIVAGNLAVVTVNKAAIDDVEAVAEWRIDGDAAGVDLGAEPELPAMLALVRDRLVIGVESGSMPCGVARATAFSMSSQATRAPPSAIPA